MDGNSFSGKKKYLYVNTSAGDNCGRKGEVRGR